MFAATRPSGANVQNASMHTVGPVRSILLFAGLAGFAHAQTTYLEEGFTLEVVTDDVPAARQIAEAPDGTLFVGSSSRCDRLTSVYAVVPNADGDTEVVDVDTSLRCPSGVALRDGDLYVAALNRVLRYPNILQTFRGNPSPEVVADDLPDDTWHGWKYLAFGPDGYLYVPVGAPCNVCERLDDERFSTILRMDPEYRRNHRLCPWRPQLRGHGLAPGDGPDSGSRKTGATGRATTTPPTRSTSVQMRGVATTAFPTSTRTIAPGEPGRLPRSSRFGSGKDATDYLRSEHLIQAHSAALGVTFYNGDQFPSHYCGAMFIAEHGSWNRYGAGKAGYRVSVLRFARHRIRTRRSERRVRTFRRPGRSSTRINRDTGRPNDVVVSRDGSLLIADDGPAGSEGAIYRIRYTPPDGRHDADRVRRHCPYFDVRAQEPRDAPGIRPGRQPRRGHGPPSKWTPMTMPGQRRGPVTLAARRRRRPAHFNSADLEDGNEDKGLTGKHRRRRSSDWRIELRGDGLEVLSYHAYRRRLRHQPARHGPPARARDRHRQRRRYAASYEYRYDVPILNPGRNANQASTLRLVNPSGHAAEVTVTGIDDQGVSGESVAALTLAGASSRSLSAADLESGEGLRNAQGLGTGTGKWRLVVASDRPILVASLLASPTGHLTNLSTVPDNKVADGESTSHVVPLFPAHGDASNRQGFVRIVNRSDQTGAIEIRAQDDSDQQFPTLTLNLGASQSVHFNSRHLEQGNEATGWTEGIGAGEGNWRLTLTSELDLDVLAYIRRTTDGFLTSMHDFVRRTGTGTYEVAFFNPGRNTDQVSKLRILNTGEADAAVSIAGTDDQGNPSRGTVELTVPAGTTRTYSAEQLEAENDDFASALGTGTGKWRLTVTSEQPIRVMSLLENQGTGHLTNLSTVAASQPWQWDQ